MDDSRIWFYAVLVFFAFVSWLRKRIKEVNEARRERTHSQQYERKVEEKREQSERREIQPQTQPEPQAAAKPPGSLKELFQQVAEEQAKAQREAQRTKTPPPPLPKPVESRDEGYHQEEGIFNQENEAFHQKDEGFHQAEGTFHQKHQAGTVHQGLSLQVKKRHHREKISDLRSDRTRLAITAAFSNRGKLRNAIILKEILDTPKGLQ